MMSSSVEEKDFDQYLTDVLSYSAERLAKVRDDDYYTSRCGVFRRELFRIIIFIIIIFRRLSLGKHY